MNKKLRSIKEDFVQAIAAYGTTIDPCKPVQTHIPII